MRAFDIHFTAGEGGPGRVVRTLRSRGLSTSFTIDRDGTITQHADLDTVTYDSGVANAWTRGVEIVSRGCPPAHASSPREVYTATVHGRACRFLAFYESQTESCHRLASAVCSAFGIPWRFPVDVEGQLLTRAMTESEQRVFTGVLGHYHLTPTKVDPGPRILQDLMSGPPATFDAPQSSPSGDALVRS